jgi:hypothetical protein
MAVEQNLPITNGQPHNLLEKLPTLIKKRNYHNCYSEIAHKLVFEEHTI